MKAEQLCQWLWEAKKAEEAAIEEAEGAGETEAGTTTWAEAETETIETVTTETDPPDLSHCQKV